MPAHTAVLGLDGTGGLVGHDQDVGSAGHVRVDDPTGGADAMLQVGAQCGADPGEAEAFAGDPRT